MVDWRICPICGKKETSLLKSLEWKSDASSPVSFCSDECRNKFKEKKEVEKEMLKKGMTKEIKCKCNKCGKVWHYLESREKDIIDNIKTNAKVQAGFAFFNIGAATQAKRNVDAQKESLEKLKSCPNCGSRDVTQEDTYFKIKN